MFEIRCPLREAGYTSRDKAGLICPEGTLTFYEYDQLVSIAARRLVAAGIKAGERVGLVCAPGWRPPVLMLALIRAGAVACMMDPELAPDEMAGVLDRLRCRRIIAPDDGVPIAQDNARDVLNASRIAELGACGEAGEFPERIEAERPATVVLGRRSGDVCTLIQHSFKSHYYSALGCNANIRLRSHDRFLLTQPLHAMESVAVVFRCLLGGATLVLPEAGKGMVESAVLHGVTHVSVSRPELDEWFRTPGIAGGALRAVMVDEAVEASLLDRAASVSFRVYAHYGVPEMASQVSAVRESASPAEQVTSGRVLRYRELRLADDGEILVRGHTLFAGYAEGDVVVRPDLRDGWFATGDFGRMGADGCLTVLRRQ